MLTFVQTLEHYVVFVVCATDTSCVLLLFTKRLVFCLPTHFTVFLARLMFGCLVGWLCVCVCVRVIR